MFWMSIKSPIVFLVLQDSGANMVASVRECGLESLSCFIHTLQLSINDSFFSQRAVKTIITTNRNIVSHFNHSPLAINWNTVLRRSKGQRELNPFLFQAEFPPHFWPPPYYLSSHVNKREQYEISGGSANKGWLQIWETNVE